MTVFLELNSPAPIRRAWDEGIILIYSTDRIFTTTYRKYFLI